MNTPNLPNFRTGTRWWNYRLVRHNDPGDVRYAIHEVHYADGQIIAIAAEPVSVSGDDLQWIVERLQEALQKPPIDFETRKEL